ncbi:hypothetical protein DB30_04891 [Enhygromyxa salina]|uniref:Uncharacterized protein n=1 Tax=Enhygromyxa salina TaxID=215803 RepID=A0A0C1ZY41_9BACT|nr:hypothetical protein [Enhygromyxa salina]KIG16173.1 hypothetical protein DB30_04891 [Enhygromyxa salina]
MGLLITGGVVATTGMGMTIAFTILGDQLQEREDPAIADIEQRDDMARIGGVLLVSGLAFVAAGGIVFASAARRKGLTRTEARIRIAPAVGGVLVSGQF